jgi:type IV pilus biogenesis protein CpaD/CtpE
MKKLVALFLLGAMALFLVGCTETPSATPDQTESQTENKTAEKKEEKKDVSLKVLSTKISADYEKKPVLIVEYEFINNTDEANSFDLMVEDNIFQGGVECGGFVVMAMDNKEINDKSDAKVQTGTAHVFSVGYLLTDTETPVEVEAKEAFAFSDPEVYLKETINLK